MYLDQQTLHRVTVARGMEINFEDQNCISNTRIQRSSHLDIREWKQLLISAEQRARGDSVMSCAIRFYKQIQQHKETGESVISSD
ncbi:hypothetical protein PoB_002075000 [Plakobranchus ocellatus]|uniref:Uncharacterized protein n=1 Tax=Plakobranchus ocellatus TaxID=259542 RepID=A0AAV3ZGG5_9GAST|nr:hypothetical protein PoB_002075000 [Plakobranchus ocellatus]